MQPAPANSVSTAEDTPARSLFQRLAAWFVDNRYSVSRPKLLFTIAGIDAFAIVSAHYMAQWALGLDPQLSILEIAKIICVAFAIVAVLRMRWSYTISALRSPSKQFSKIIVSVLSVLIPIAGLSYAFAVTPWPPSVLVSWTTISIAALAIIRLATAEAVNSLTRSNLLVRRTVIVGGGTETTELMQALAEGNDGQLQILGIFDDRLGTRADDTPSALKKLGTFEDLAEFCQQAGVDLLIVNVPPRAEERLLHILQKLFALQVDVRISALNSKLRLNSSAYNYVGKVPMLAVMDKPLTDWDRVLKNIEDRVIGTLLLIAVAPIMALVALAIRLDSRGPILFKQKRFGFDNELIEVYKFRSMYIDQSDATATRLVTKDDPRVTRVGRFIRRASLDELPQLFNVLRGEMSLVGPRPHATRAKADSDLYQDVVQGYFARHRVKPGVTGWAQVNGWRGETDTREKIERRVEHDLHYIDHWSLPFDLYILAMTPIALLTSKNAY